MELFMMLGLAAFLLIACYQYLKARNSIFKILKIPSPDAKLLLGNLQELSAKAPPLVLREWTKRFGKTYGYMEGGKPVLVSSDLDFLQDVFIKNFSSFHGRKEFPLQPNPDKDPGVSVFTARGQRWKRLRAIANPIFTTAKLKQVIPIVNDSIKEMLEIIEPNCESGEEFDVYQYYQRLTMDVIAKVAFGYEMSVHKGENESFYNAVKAIFGKRSFLGNIFTIAATILPEFTAFWRMCARCTAKLRGVPFILIKENLKKIVDYRRENKASWEGQRADFISLMLEAEAEEGWDAGSLAQSDPTAPPMLKVAKKLSPNEIVEQMFVFLLAGQDTTSTALAFASSLLTKHPDVQERVFNELKSVFQTEDQIDHDSVGQLKYLDLVVKETLRLYPNASVVVSRKTMEPRKIGDHYLPQDLVVSADVWSIHYDTELWGQDAAEFRPERMSVEESAGRHPMAWIPFGAGPRNCLGMRFALLEVKLTLARLLLRYQLLPSSKTPVEPELQGYVTVSPKNVTIKIAQRER